ncbi:MAG TPA: HpcH/HpaI aldolase/citrate lyase family protein [Plantibacter sp.]|uniref:HpcH/HpaI aldolase family protein n=1 Tax=unclassified Plantibacter TaxID=2624265 RepID=UPI002CE13602|nr:HpcH/HpaI aldolase/citrate lyase family protein [Plantibacter sp.]
MPIRMTLPPTFGERLRTADRPLVGMWVVSGSPVAAEIAAGSGLDLILIDGEHSANTLESIQLQLQVVAAFPVCPLVRVPFGDAVIIKQVLDLGAQNLIVPMVESAQQAEALVRAMRYPPQGVRGVGSALARSSRWNRVDGYLADADDSVSLTVQIESANAVEHAEEILAVDGVDAVFVGPADLSASLGLLGQQGHPEVLAAVERVLAAATTAGKPAGVNAFDPVVAEHYLEHGASFVLVGADVALLARASEGLAERFIERRRSPGRSDGY